MRLSLVLILLTTFMFFSCKKIPYKDPALEGKWKMVEVKDNANDSMLTKPASINAEVEIVLSYSTSGKGKMSGHTTIALVSGDFTVGVHKTFSMPAIYFDYSGVDMIWGSVEWDNEFSNITISKDYFFDSEGRLNINTTNNKTILFLRE